MNHILSFPPVLTAFYLIAVNMAVCFIEYSGIKASQLWWNANIATATHLSSPVGLRHCGDWNVKSHCSVSLGPLAAFCPGNEKTFGNSKRNIKRQLMNLKATDYREPVWLLSVQQHKALSTFRLFKSRQVDRQKLTLNEAF